MTSTAIWVHWVEPRHYRRYQAMRPAARITTSSAARTSSVRLLSRC